MKEFLPSFIPKEACAPRVFSLSSEDSGPREALGIRTGFTLIELLVVIAIIAILAAMLMPALSKAREAAKTSDCISRQKQLVLSAQMYADSNSSMMPLYVRFNCTKCGLKHYTWVQHLACGGYATGGKIQGCPSVPDVSGDGDGVTKERYYCYGVSGHPDSHSIYTYRTASKLSNGYSEPTFRALYVNRAKKPASVMYTTDTWTEAGGRRQIYMFRYRFTNDDWYPSARHNGNFLMSFIDGHAGTIAVNEFIAVMRGDTYDYNSNGGQTLWYFQDDIAKRSINL